LERKSHDLSNLTCLCCSCHSKELKVNAVYRATLLNAERRLA